LMPLAFATGDRSTELCQFHPEAVVAQLKAKSVSGAGDGVLYDAVFDRQFLATLLDAVSRRRSFRGRSWEIAAVPSKHFRKLRDGADSLEPTLARKEQSNTSITYGDRFILKIVRRLQQGVNPDLEISRFLTEKTEFQQTPALAGSLDLEFSKSTNGGATVGILQAWVRNEGDGWNYTLDQLGDYFEKCAARSDKFDGEIRPLTTLLDSLKQDVPPLAREMIGPYLATASLLGQRTGELHVALASDAHNPDFAPEPVTQFYRRSRYQSLRTATDSALTLLKECMPRLPEEARAAAALLLPLKSAILARFRLAVDRKITAMRIRCHGDYHLGQVLFTGKDFVIIDFEGEPARPLAQRRAKRSALVDVAGMLRSFDYAENFALRAGEFREDEQQRMKSWGQYWVYWVSKNFLEAYLKSADGGGFLPSTTDELKILLELSTLQKALYELTYELNNRPDWVSTPIRGILEILQATP